LGDGLPVTDLVYEVGLRSSKRDVRRLIEDGGLSVDGARVESVEHAIRPDDFANGSSILLKAGKKNFLRVVLN
jgi:tyrosyl-tRNA synthetase